MNKKKMILTVALSGIVFASSVSVFSQKIVSASVDTPSASASPKLSKSALTADASISAEAPKIDVIKDITIGVGANETSMNFNWLNTKSSENIDSTDSGIGTVTISDGKTTKVYTADVVSKVARFDDSEFSNKVNVTDLKPNTKYTYFVTNGNVSSPKYSFKTANGDNFSFLFAGDPQIGASGNNSDTAIDSDIAGWDNTLTKTIKKFPNIDFLYSAGDQINDYANSDSKKKQVDGFFSPNVIKNLPLATTIGNHDNGNKGGYDDLFNMPNVSTLGSTAYTQGDYYFTYGSALFLNLNSNNASAAEHKKFMENAIAKNPNAKWKIVVLHHSIYSVATHAKDQDILNLRTNLTPVIDDLKIDAVLDGHDHVYTRSFQMFADKPIKNQLTNTQGQILSPKGTLYVTTNSASGSKFYKITVPTAFYAEKEEQINVPEISKIDMTQNSFTITTYRTDTMEATDKYSILK